MNEISQKELKTWTKAGKEFQLVDVRERSEFELFNIGGELMPLSEFTNHIDKIRDDIPVVIHCRSGKRSADAIQYLAVNHGYTNLLNLVNGVLNWNEE
jgi:adenylyltransferase/sulfurtransferase